MCLGLRHIYINIFLSSTLTHVILIEAKANCCKVVGNLCLAMNETSAWHLYQESKEFKRF